MLETYEWVDNSGGFTTLVEPDFDETPEVIEICEYCGSTNGAFPTMLGIYVALLCDTCSVFRLDEIAYDIGGI